MPKNIEYNFLINFEECDKLFGQIAKAKLKKGNYSKQEVKTKTAAFAEAYLDFKEQYKQCDWGNFSTLITTEEFKQYRTHWRNMYVGFNYISNVLEQYGMSKTLAVKCRYAACNFKESAEKAMIYNGAELPTVENIMNNAFISGNARIGKEFSANNAAVEKLNNAFGLNVSDNPKHKNSKEFQNLLLSITELKNEFASAETDGKYNENAAKDLEKEHAYAIGKRMDQLKKAAEAYISAKGGVGNQYTQLGKDRMAMAVEALAFVSENQAFYPSNARILEHATHVVKNEYSDKETREANREIERVNQLIKEGDEPKPEKDYGYLADDDFDAEYEDDALFDDIDAEDYFEK